MGLVESLRNIPERQLGCRINNILDSLTPEERAELQLILGKHRVSNAAIARVLSDNGHETTHDQVGRHRRGGCLCSKT